LRVPRHRKAFIVPEKALAKRFRGRFVDLARRAIPNITLPEGIWSKSWVVFAKPAVHGAERVLEYLGRYVHRTALSGKALLAADDQHVTFRYRDSRDEQHKTMTLPVDEFLRRFLQHVPPKGFHRVRAFGLLHPEHTDSLEFQKRALRWTAADHPGAQHHRQATLSARAPNTSTRDAIASLDARTKRQRRGPTARSASRPTRDGSPSCPRRERNPQARLHVRSRVVQRAF
jgi:hypothetical protein